MGGCSLYIHDYSILDILAMLFLGSCTVRYQTISNGCYLTLRGRIDCACSFSPSNHSNNRKRVKMAIKVWFSTLSSIEL